jgi:hypothetical protein
VPPTLDRVMSNAFKKSAAVRIESVGKLADMVGQAYGLEGTHLAWANCPEADLTRQMEAKLAEVMKTLPPPQADASDDFFGEGDALGGMDQAFKAAGAAVGGYTGSDLEVAGVPKGSAGWIVPVALGGSVLVIGLVVVLMLFH